MSIKNAEIIVDIVKSGIKDKSEKLGVELEYTLTYEDKSQVKYDDEFGQKWLMNALRDEYEDDILDEEGHLIGVAGKRDTLTLEPAGQFELSAGPFVDVEDAYACFEHLINRINALVNPHGIVLNALGYHPKCKAEDLKIIPKVRYHLMNEYFQKFSPLGIRMMRGTGSTQVSIDYHSVDDCLNKFRIAFCCSPIFALLCDNTAIFEGKPRTHSLMRTEVWEDCDKSRCGIVPGALSSDFTLEDYAEYVLNTPQMFETIQGKQVVSGRKLKEIYEDKTMTEAQAVAGMSQLFNDVRLKNFIEIRPADALPLPYAMAYVALIKGLFYGKDSLNKLQEIFVDVVKDEQYESAKQELMKSGYDAEIYGKSAQFYADKLIETAKEGLTDKDVKYLAPFEKLVAEKRTLAD